jgi:hypothetical protein
VSGYSQPAMVAGPIEYKRDYTLWVLVVLIIFCWPAAILYYFTRDKVPVQTMRTYATPMGQPYGGGYAAPGGVPPAAGGKFCPACGTANAPNAGFCARCGKALP